MAATPNSERTHIGIFGRSNCGKSSLLNALTGQQVALVSPVAGTTTDPVSKPMEINGLGACVLIDTAGYDDYGELGQMRVGKTAGAMERCDVAVVVFCDSPIEEDRQRVEQLRSKKIPIVAVINKIDVIDYRTLAAEIKAQFGLEAIGVCAINGEGIDQLRNALVNSQSDKSEVLITGDLCGAGDTVILIMPQDPQAPKGRLILPQVQTIRELLDKNCTIISSTVEGMSTALSTLTHPPKLIITDSQAFKAVYEQKPKSSLLTSFSVLMAGYKGDIRAFIEGASAIDRLTPQSHVLIAEACTHAPLSEDIGRVKIPRMLKNKIGNELQISIVAGSDFPQDLTPYDLVIHCGGCMFNRRHVLNRIEQARRQGVAITNYGIVIAYINNIIDKVVYPG